MGVPERSRERVEAKLDEFEDVYGSFVVNQTTITLPDDQYTELREHGNPDPVTAYVAVYNDDDEILHVDADGGHELPGIAAQLTDSLEPALRAEVSDTAAIDCVVDGLDQVTIAGLRNADDPEAETLYNLVVVFHATHEAGTPAEDAAWFETPETVQPIYA
jgi:hypothetical protein